MFTTNRQGAVFVVSGAGPLNAEQISAARDAFDACFGKGLPRVVFNLQRVQLLDGAGLELLLDMHDRCAAQGGALVLATANPLCRDILRVTQLERSLPLFDSVVSAVGSFAQ